VISSIAGIKKRPVPGNPEHLSVGSDATRTQRNLAANVVKNDFVLKRDDIKDLFLDEATMRLYGMPMEIPPTPGGERPHECGAEMKCDRCGQGYIVTENNASTACQFHWGRPIRSKTGGMILDSPAMSSNVYRNKGPNIHLLFGTLSIFTRMSDGTSKSVVLLHKGDIHRAI
jgi:hypothetical protein